MLVEKTGTDSFEEIPFQVERQSSPKLWWMLAPNGKTERSFALRRGKSSLNNRVVSIRRDEKTLIVGIGDKQLLQYNHATVYPPEGVDPVFKRSAFIHPLWSPHGQALTRIQPPDHYHHYGIWNPWTHILFRGDTLDLWNLDRRHGTVRFSKFESIESGPVYGGYSAVHEHVAFKNGRETTLLNETQHVRIFNPGSNDHYIVDITIQLSCATEDPVRLLSYRYGGFGWRTTEEWTNKNSEVLTSGGKTRKDADGSKARWCLVQGEVGGDYAGVLMMSGPSNYNHPEPLRIWPENQYGRGDMFANFSPTKDKDWNLQPGNVYELKYRLVVFNGRFDHARSEKAWEHFVSPNVVERISTK